MDVPLLNQIGGGNFSTRGDLINVTVGLVPRTQAWYSCGYCDDLRM
jgi:hypothetical protein